MDKKTFVIRIENVTKIYAEKKISVHALQGISVVLPTNGMIFIVGKSGCGKSTLLNVLGGLDRPTSGKVIFDGKEICYDKERYLDGYRKKDVGFIFQDHLLVDDLTVKENIKSGVELQGKTVSEADLLSVLNAVGIADVADKMPFALSGGQRQRVAIARALIKNPSIILADEPTGNLDSESGRTVFDILKKISETTLVVVVSHDLDSAYRYADRIIELKDGKVCSDRQKTKEFDLDALKRKYNEAIRSAYADTPTEKRETVLPQAEKKRKNKSQLSMKDAFRTMGGWLKTSFSKPKNVLITLLTFLVISLSLTALGLFNNIASYDYDEATLNSLRQSEYDTAMILKKNVLRLSTAAQSDTDEEQSAVFTNEEIADLETAFPDAYKTYYYGYDFAKYVNATHAEYNAALTGICKTDAECSAQTLRNFYGATLTDGRYPRKNKNAVEILISDYTADSILYYGANFENGTVLPNVAPDRLLGKTFESHSVSFKIVGIYDCSLSALYQGDTASESTVLSYAKAYVYSVGLCVRGAVSAVLDSLTGVSISAEFKPSSSGTFQSYTTQFLSVDGCEDIQKIAETNGTTVKYAADFDGNFTENDVVVSFGRYLDIYNLYRYSEEGQLLSAFASVTEADLNDLHISEKTDETVTEYRVVGIFDDASISQNLMIVSSAVKNKHIASLLSVPAYFVPLSENGAKAVMRYCTEKGFHVMAPFSEKLYYFSMIFSMFGDTVTIATAVIVLFVVMLLVIIIGKNLRERSKDIGILRALGANRADIIKIFIFNDIFYVVTAFVLSLLMYFVGIAVFNATLSAQFGVSVVFLSGSVLSVLWMFLTAVAVVAVASYFPIRKYSSVPPINVIKGVEK